MNDFDLQGWFTDPKPLTGNGTGHPPRQAGPGGYPGGNGRVVVDFRDRGESSAAVGSGLSLAPASHSPSFDQRFLAEAFRTAMATARFWPTRTTSLFPRVIPV